MTAGDVDLFAQRTLAAATPRFCDLRPVRFQDIDAAGIVFFPRILEYFHDAYVAFLASVDLPLDRVLRDRVFVAPIRRANAEFLRPLRFGDRIAVGLVRATIDGSTLTIGYRIARAGSDEVLAVGTTVHVFVDATFARMPAPDVAVQAFSALCAD